MSKYRYGTYYLGKLSNPEKKIVIDGNTDEKEIEAFLKESGDGMRKRILEGNSELSYKIAAEQKAKRAKLKTAQQEEDERVAKMIEEKVEQASKKPRGRSKK